MLSLKLFFFYFIDREMFCFGSIKAYKGQQYDKLKKEAKQKGNLFIDLEFPPDDRSLFYSQGKLADVVWKRPKVTVL
jgi:hypothetical protein